jgi:hypothetical protein
MDAGMEASVLMDGSTDVATDAEAKCPTPKDVSGMKFPAMPPPTGKHQGQCTQMQLDAYHKCLFANDTAACDVVKGTQCLFCIDGYTTGGAWGPIYCDEPKKCFPNQQGCLNLALGQMGAGSCGELLHQSYSCQKTACASCGDDAPRFNQCAQTASAGVCQQHADAFLKQCGQFLNIDPDGGYPEVANCFRLQSEMDPKGLRTRIDTYFCGP